MMTKEKEMAEQIAKAVAKQGGRAYFVGGFVRDALLGRENTDIDMEVHGVSSQTLEAILDELGERITVGASFGIYGLKGISLDIAMPRKEHTFGKGHRDLSVVVDPFAGVEKAASRRDLTINGMMMDILTGELIDPFHGEEDLKNGVIRHINDKTFAEDPLRVLRAAKFSARLGFPIAEETVSLCKTVDLGALPKERVAGELFDVLLHGERPSLFFEALRSMEQLDLWFPEIKALLGVEQNPVHHGEGDVWDHTMLALDHAAAVRERAEYPLGFMLVALTHDLGKAVCSQKINGVIHAYEHEIKGLPLAEAFLRRLTDESKLLRYVLEMNRSHMKPNVAAAALSSVKATNHMFDSVSFPRDLILFSDVDQRSSLSEAPLVSHLPFLEERLKIYEVTMAKPFVMGRDLMEAGLSPDGSFGELLDYAHKLRLAGVEKDAALKQILALARKRQKNKK